jgi:hypothetical protein
MKEARIDTLRLRLGLLKTPSGGQRAGGPLESRFNRRFLKYFVSSKNLREHPMKKTRLKLRAMYYAVLEYVVRLYSPNAEYTDARLEQYRSALLDGKTSILID